MEIKLTGPGRGNWETETPTEGSGPRDIADPLIEMSLLDG